MRISQAPSLDVVKASVLTTQGDIIQRGAIVPERLGSAGTYQILLSTGVGSALLWGNNTNFYATGGPNFRVKIFDLPTWDMDTVPLIGILHGLTYANIIGVYGSITPDVPGLRRGISPSEFVQGGQADLYIEYWEVDYIYIGRRTGGFYDNTDFDSTVSSRGKIFVLYTI